MHGLKTIGKWLIALGALALLAGGAYVIHKAVLAERKGDEDDAVKNPARKQGNDVVLGPELAKKEGVKDEPARQVEWQPRLTVYGRVVPNPRATIEVRAPFAGSLRAAAGKPWPELGSRVKTSEVMGCLDIRVGPQEQLDMQAKLHDARLKEKGAEDVFRVEKERLEKLEAASTGVAPADVDAARVKMVNARTELATANAAVTRWQEALTDITRASRKGDVWSRTLPAPADGEITELAARPGTAVEAGGLIARLVDFARPLVRLDMPIEILSRSPPAKLEIHIVGMGRPHEPADVAVWAKRVGLAPQVDAASQLAGYWYEVDLSGGKKDQPRPEVWRPGLFVRADVPDMRMKATKAMTVPATALVYHDGRSFVYVREAPGRYERRQVQVLGHDGDGVVFSGAVRAGEPVVCAGAQILLSEEFRESGGKADDD
jgi:cobalt-zinc-cadmium efflux system membrane fusion protein